MRGSPQGRSSRPLSWATAQPIRLWRPRTRSTPPSPASCAASSGLKGLAGAVNLTSSPQITAGTVDGQPLLLVGLHATNTVQIDNGTGVRLCGNTGSVIVGLNLDDLYLRWSTANSAWTQQGCSRAIYGATDLASAFKICDAPNGQCINSSIARVREPTQARRLTTR